MYTIICPSCKGSLSVATGVKAFDALGQHTCGVTPAPQAIDYSTTPARLQIVERLSATEIGWLRDRLSMLSDHLEADVSNYARGRRRFWINYEGPLSAQRQFQPAVKDGPLWDWIHDRFPEVDLGLAAYGDIGIGLHRDATYAGYKAYMVNVGSIGGWLYDCQYKQYHYSPAYDCHPSNVVTHTVGDGDVVCFNAKNQHATVNPGADRWSINLWSVSAARRAEFNAYVERNKD